MPIGIGLLLPVFYRTSIFGHVLGWRGAFLVTGLIDLAWILAWLRIYKRPEDHPRVSASELALIRSDAVEATVKIPWRRLFRHRQTWAFAVGQRDDRLHVVVLPVQRPPLLRRPLPPRSRAPRGPGRVHLHLRLRRQHRRRLDLRPPDQVGLVAEQGRKVTLFCCALLVLPVFYAAITADPLGRRRPVHPGRVRPTRAWSANVFSLAGDMFPRRVVGSVVGLGGMAARPVRSSYLSMPAGSATRPQARGEIGDYLPIFGAASLAYIIAFFIVQGAGSPASSRRPSRA